MTSEALCYNVGADAAASGAANFKFARSTDARSQDGRQWWETYQVATRIATIEASIRRTKEVVRYAGSDFSKLVESRDAAVKRKLDEAISNSTSEHRIFRCPSGWTRCYDCPCMARPENKEYWRSNPCLKKQKKQRKCPSAEHLRLWQYVSTNPT